MYDSLMQRWNVPFDYIEEHWTNTEFLHLLAAVIESNLKEEREMRRSRSNSGRASRRVSPREMEG